MSETNLTQLFHNAIRALTNEHYSIQIVDTNTFTVTWAGTDPNITNQQILDKRAELEG
jgi:hypothetical protein|tara:strand:+ start:583 stop:756 length:174 start_codon:yes stop_codon:yes gene_type:complete